MRKLDLDNSADKLGTAIRLTCGYTSVCWDKEGAFQTERVLEATQELQEWIESRYTLTDNECQQQCCEL